MVGEYGEEWLPDETGGAGDCDGMHPHTLTAWPTRLNPETPRSPTRPDDAVPGFPRFLFGGARRRLRPVHVRLLPDRPRPGDADAAVDRTRSTGRSPARPPSGSRSRAGPSRRSTPRDRAQFEELAHAAQTLVVGETGLTATFATTLRDRRPARAGSISTSSRCARCSRPSPPRSARRCSRSSDDPDEADDELAGAAASPGTPFAAMAGLAGMGNMLAMLAPALLGVQAGSMIGYLAQHTLGRYDLPLPTGAPARRRRAQLCFVVANIDTFEDGVVAPARRPALLRRAARDRARGGPLGAVGARAGSCALSIEYVSSYEIDPSAFEAEFGMIDPAGPGVAAAHDREPRAGARRDAVAAPGRAARGAAAAHVGDRGLRRPRARAASGAGSSPRSTRSTRRCSATASSAARPSASSRACSGSSSSARTTSGAQAFVDGVVERAGIDGLNRLWDEPGDAAHPERARRPRPLAGPHRPPRPRLTPTRIAPGRPQSDARGSERSESSG